MPLRLVRRQGSPNWYIRGTLGGEGVYESTGTDRREVADALRVRREAELLDRRVHGRRKAATFAEAVVSYLEEGGEARYLAPLLDRFEHVRLAEIGQAAADAAARALYPRAGPATRNRQLYTPLSAVLNAAARAGLCEPPRLRRPRQPPGRVRFLEPAEADRLVAAAAPHLAPLLTFLFGTGCRPGEALELDWRDVDLTRAHVIFWHTKTGEPRGVPLPARVVAALANLPHRTGAVFRTPAGRPYARRAHRPGADRGGGEIGTAFATACRRAGIADFHPHDCRHTFATWHWRAHRDPLALMRLAGWKSMKMVERYAHIAADDLRAAADALPWAAGGG